MPTPIKGSDALAKGIGSLGTQAATTAGKAAIKELLNQGDAKTQATKMQEQLMAGASDAGKATGAAINKR